MGGPGSGRHPLAKTQIRKFFDEHPEAVDKLLEVLYLKGLAGDTVAAQYVIDRKEGRPRQQTDISITGEVTLTPGERLAALGPVRELEALIEGKFEEVTDVQIQGESQDSSSGEAEEASPGCDKRRDIGGCDRPGCDTGGHQRGLRT